MSGLAILLLAWVELGTTGALYDQENMRLRAPGKAAADFALPTVAVIRRRAERLARQRAESKILLAFRLLQLPSTGDRRRLESTEVVSQTFGADGSVELILEVAAKPAAGKVLVP